MSNAWKQLNQDEANQFLDAEGDLYTFHIEAVEDVTELAKKVKGRDKQFGLSVKPDTPVSEILPYLDLLDLVLIMTVEPGFGGQSLIEKTLPKISEVKAEIEKRKLPTLIEVDGGVNLSTVQQVVKHGADIVVMGSAFFKNDDYNSFIKEVQHSLTRVPV